MRTTALALAILFGISGAFSGIALANGNGYDKDSPSDHNNGKGNDPGNSGKAPGHNKLFDDTVPTWLDEHLILANVPPGSGNWGGGPGNSGPGDKNGQNNHGGGGQTPPGQDKK